MQEPNHIKAPGRRQLGVATMVEDLLVSVFLVCPAVFDVMRERQMTKLVWYDPVR
jgi:hypothetical protein